MSPDNYEAGIQDHGINNKLRVNAVRSIITTRLRSQSSRAVRVYIHNQRGGARS